MVRSIILPDGKRMPALGWGNGTRGVEHSGKFAVDVGAAALREGILHIDTAQAYGTERETGEAIRLAEVPREQVWVTTKIYEGSGQPHRKVGEVRAAVQESVAKLGFIPDLLLVHTPFVPEDGRLLAFWQELENMVEDGTLQGCSLGVSNFRPQDIEILMHSARIKPVCNQIEFHPYALAHLDSLFATHSKYGIATQAYGPLQPLIAHPTGGPIKPILKRIAGILSNDSGQNVDEASVLLLWTIGKGAAAITTSSNPVNIAKMAAIDRLRDLTEAEIDEIDQAGRKVHFKGWAGHMSKDYPVPDLPEDV
ncbi:NADP-dependent oxidoreductase domain-containing protein [Kockovaella imperatae]|uniref:NADP-dependent oxidoreductase domain-containing protein n=1 Tax=Kockovaella imperatae TaxID=4999 RepID=A0A1Y1UGA4_9TREE|nr:NADP-dependent oxidoreductase domain-containing protein [Kockovaella imperatae]ORX37009.1 NADP-dependent oxidoreductase domain-containing protein [Kockovaella imperatae]